MDNLSWVTDRARLFFLCVCSLFLQNLFFFYCHTLAFLFKYFISHERILVILIIIYFSQLFFFLVSLQLVLFFCKTTPILNTSVNGPDSSSPRSECLKQSCQNWCNNRWSLWITIKQSRKKAFNLPRFFGCWKVFSKRITVYYSVSLVVVRESHFFFGACSNLTRYLRWDKDF